MIRSSRGGESRSSVAGAYWSLLLLMVGLSLAAPAGAQPIFNPANGHYYELIYDDQGVSWFRAQADAAARVFDGQPGHLATVTDAAEWTFLVENLPGISSGETVFLGGSDDDSEGNWYWITGEPWTFENWNTDEPNNACCIEHCLEVIAAPGPVWNDVPCELPANRWLVEYEPQLSQAPRVPQTAGLGPGCRCLSVPSMWALIDKGRFAEAEEGSRTLLAHFEEKEGSDSLAVAEVAEVLVAAMRRGGKAQGAEIMRLADRAVSIREKRLGPFHRLVGHALALKANVLYERGKYSEAKPLLEKALKIYKAADGPKALSVAGVHNDLGNVCREMFELELARKHLHKAVELYEAKHGPRHLDVADALGNLGNVQSGTEAEATYLRALAIKEEVLGPDHPGLASILHNYGFQKWGMGHYEEARPLMERSIALSELSLGPDHPDLADSLLNYGHLMLHLGYLERGEKAYKRAISIYSKVNHPHLPGGLYNYGLLVEGRGDVVLARQLFERSLAIVERADGSENPLAAWILQGASGPYIELGEYELARDSLDRAGAIIRETLGPDDPQMAENLRRLAILETTRGNLDQAGLFAEAALEAHERTKGAEHPDAAEYLWTLGQVLARTGRNPEAEAAYRRALSITERSKGPDHVDLEPSLVGLADVYAEEGNCRQAVPLYLRAVELLEQEHGADHPGVAEVRLKMAECLARLGRTDEAFDSALQAEVVSRELLQLMLTGLAERVGLQYAASRQSGLDLALSLLAGSPSAGSAGQAFDAVIQVRALVLDEVAARRRSSNTESEQLEITTVAQRFTEARNRLAFLTFLETRDRESQAKRFADAQQEFASLAVRGPAPTRTEAAYRRLLQHARENRDRAERELAESSRDFRLRLQARKAGLREVQGALPAGSGLVAYVRSEYSPIGAAGASAEDGVEAAPSYAAFVLRAGDEEPVFVPLGTAIGIEGLVTEMRRHLNEAAKAPEWAEERAEQAYRESGEELRQLIWDPLERHLGGVDRVFIVPDGALNLVNLQSLPMGESEYLIERGPQMHYLSAERDLVPDPDAPGGSGLFVLGDPAFDAPSLFSALAPAPQEVVADRSGTEEAERRLFRGRRSACGSFQDLHFEELPASGAEVREVVNVWREGHLSAAAEDSMVDHLSGAGANETAFKLQAPGRQVLHLATHGFFLGGRCRSLLDPGEDTGARGAAVRLVSESPLLLSGLAMAGANNRQAASPDEDDGILTAEEISALDLSGTEWAVLSACETGLGEVRAGEGVLGLRRAFQVAGAKTLIISLWRVEDEPTREWMGLLYERRFVDGLDTAEAVHRASLELLRQRREEGLGTHPFYWAGFVAAGDWR